MKLNKIISGVCAVAFTVICAGMQLTEVRRTSDDWQLNAGAIEYKRIYYTDENMIRYAVSIDNQTATVTGYFGYEEEIVIPPSIKYPLTDDYSVELPVTDINIDGYYETYEGEPGHLYQIKKVTLPGSIESLEFTFTGGYDATEKWTSLEEIVIEEGVKSIGFGLFYEAKKVKKVTIPASVTTIDSDAFVVKNETIKSYRDRGGVIYGYSGSITEKFAKFNSIPFIPLGTAPSPAETTTTSTTTTTTTTTATSVTTTTTTAAPSLPDLEISASSITLKEGEQYTISANQSNLTYKSNNTDVAVVSKSGIVTALSEGTALISVINADGDVAQMNVKVTPVSIEGDCNNDGVFNISDVVLLQKWLLAVPNTHLANWQEADLCKDGKLDVFDLCLMKRALLSSYTRTNLLADMYC